jgi:DNA adenine methylase
VKLKAPFVYFGGKSKVADLVWSRLGDVPNYVEPFFGSGAVLLARPHVPRTETVNDINGHLCNFWRSIKHSPEETAQWATWPVSECDLHARHKALWAVDLSEQLRADETFHDPKSAGWWVWGCATCIAGSWHSSKVLSGLPHLGCAGVGVNKANYDIHSEFQRLQDRLARVRVVCGDWKRITTPTITYYHGVTGVFLDPPYGDGDNVYGPDMKSVAKDAAEWAISQGENPLMRIAYCGYEGTVKFPSNWDCVEWKTLTGGNTGKGKPRTNAKRERIWFSPHCVQEGLF